MSGRFPKGPIRFETQLEARLWLWRKQLAFSGDYWRRPWWRGRYVRYALRRLPREGAVTSWCVQNEELFYYEVVRLPDGVR